MGQKRESRPSTEVLFSTISKMLVPDYILKDFDIYDAEEKPTCWTGQSNSARKKNVYLPNLPVNQMLYLMATAIPWKH